MMILAYFRTKLCSLKMNSERLVTPSMRIRRSSLDHRPRLGIAVAAALAPRDGPPPPAGAPAAARVDRARMTSTPPWTTPAVASVEPLTTTSIANRERLYQLSTTTKNDAVHAAIRVYSHLGSDETIAAPTGTELLVRKHAVHDEALPF